MTQARITCAGIAVCDVVARTVQYPLPHGYVQLVEEMGVAEGGSALRTARALAAMGIPTRLVAAVGADDLGKLLRSSVKSEHLEVEWIEREEIGTSSSCILVSADGERTILHSIGANATLTADDITKRLRGEALHVGGGLVLPALDGEPLAALFSAAKAAGMTTSLDIVYDDTGRWDTIEPALAYTDLFCPSRAEGEAITGQADPKGAAAALRKAGVAVAIVTDGPDGCWLDSDEAVTHVPAIEVDTVDTTGAGDAFTAGALCGLMSGLPPSKAARLASAMGALATTTAGTFSPAYPDEPWALAQLEH